MTELFSFAAPHLWNLLPCNIRICETVDQFKSLLKTYLLKSVLCKLNGLHVLANCIMSNVYMLIGNHDIYHFNMIFLYIQCD